MKKTVFKICRCCDKEKEIQKFRSFTHQKTGEKKYGIYCKTCANEKSRISRMRPESRQRRKEYNQQRKEQSPLAFKIQAAFNNMNFKSRQKGINVDFSPASLTNWWINLADNCAICGLSAAEARILIKNVKNAKGVDKLLDQYKINHSHVASEFLEIDRIDANQGYSQSNCQKLCRLCNDEKGRNEMLPLSIIRDRTLEVKKAIEKLKSKRPDLDLDKLPVKKETQNIKISVLLADQLKDLKIRLRTATYTETIEKLINRLDNAQKKVSNS